MFTMTKPYDTTTICRKKGSPTNQALFDGIRAVGEGTVKTPAGNLKLKYCTEFQLLIVGRGDDHKRNLAILAALPETFEAEIV